MENRTAIGASNRFGSRPRRGRLFPRTDYAFWLVLALASLLVVPPFVFLLRSSFSVPQPGFQVTFGLKNFYDVLHAQRGVWLVTFEYALGASAVSCILGISVAWILARTDAPLRSFVLISAFISMATPILIKDIGWILLFGPNTGLVTMWLRSLFGPSATPHLFSLGGMIFIEGLIWAPVAALLTFPSLIAVNPALEEAAAMAGAGRATILRRIVMPLAAPSLIAVLMLAFVRALESFETPLLIGTPGGVRTATTALYDSIHSGFLPNYGQASAYSTILVLLVIGPLAAYYRATRDETRFAVIKGRGFQARRIELGAWRWPCAIWAALVPLSLCAPLVLMLWVSLLPTYRPNLLLAFHQMSFANYAEVWNHNEAKLALFNSVAASLISATVLSALALVAAWLIVRSSVRVRRLLDLVGSTPLVFPGVALGVAMLTLALSLRSLALYGSLALIIIAFCVKFFPYALRFCHIGMLSIDRELEESARTCGASNYTIVRRITAPVLLPSLLVAWTYVFMYSIRDLSTVLLISGAKNVTLAVLVLDWWSNGELPELAALGVVLTAAVALLAGLILRLSGGDMFHS